MGPLPGGQEGAGQVVFVHWSVRPEKSTPVGKRAAPFEQSKAISPRLATDGPGITTSVTRSGREI